MAGERPRDIVWDCLVELFGDVTNQNERGRRNKVVALLKESGATPEQIKDRFERYPSTIGGTLTDTALANNWARLAEENSTKSKVASTFQSLWPGKPFDEEGWRTVLKGFNRDQIIEALIGLAPGREFPPGAMMVKVLLVNRSLGREAPMDPATALEWFRGYRAELNTGAFTEAPAGLLSEALRGLKYPSDTAFQESYGALWSQFYAEYTP